MYSVVDVAGINRISRAGARQRRRGHGGHGPAQQRAARAGRPARGRDDRPLVAATMFGVTTPAVDAARARLAELGYEVLVFHATGAGGRALEALAADRLISGVLDLTTTELADDLVGGVLSAGPDRLTAAGARGLPQVIAPGALDMVNFGPPATVPGKFAGRLFFEHNPAVTLMRTTPREMAELGARIGRKAAAADRANARCSGRTGGVSALDADGQPFRDQAADAACRAALDRELTAAGRDAAAGRRAHQRPGFRHRDGGPAAPDDHRGRLTDGTRRALLARLRAKARGRKADHRGGRRDRPVRQVRRGRRRDLIIIYNSGRYRMAGRGSLAGLMPYGDANAIVVDMAGEVLPVVRDVRCWRASAAPTRSG